MGTNRGVEARVSFGPKASPRSFSVLVLAVIAATSRPAEAIDPVPSFRYLVTGNGFGFQVFDVGANAIKQYLERPYRYLRAKNKSELSPHFPPTTT